MLIQSWITTSFCGSTTQRQAEKEETKSTSCACCIIFGSFQGSHRSETVAGSPSYLDLQKGLEVSSILPSTEIADLSLLKLRVLLGQIDLRYFAIEPICPNPSHPNATPLRNYW